VRDRQAKRMAEQGGHGEPVGNSADEAGFRPCPEQEDGKARLWGEVRRQEVSRSYDVTGLAFTSPSVGSRRLAWRRRSKPSPVPPGPPAVLGQPANQRDR
jgi:hypothetical protein